ncbi:MAG TPA: hypothetical protein PLF31_02650 [Candidatus Paceibacterota bacterium]|nr:hypothetical protein [Candidatus Paceibacterota bacterium]
MRTNRESWILGFGCGAILTAIVALLILGPITYRLMELQDARSLTHDKEQVAARAHTQD